MRTRGGGGKKSKIFTDVVNGSSLSQFFVSAKGRRGLSLCFASPPLLFRPTGYAQERHAASVGRPQYATAPLLSLLISIGAPSKGIIDWNH